ncbi:dTDP-4-amino-4,6-dideoxygalactose transaminase [Temperatibacter marinus]|uniref:dTDP-4-amino-4,6-dideoxygalactose transaminase n=1 Tax=Temperatibacter marinus TaxID=1456591 RepID=A0AA52EEA9_9PROT|nr:dTDP-4-amino-4,6-dideoxygalactose transaminase [Temperatibacter marinus]WND03211.1 dTDP-4-amino-4,6-dideoxygalactose transaminase [Temperatibacter marinus]
MIPFNKPSMIGNEADYINQAVSKGHHISGNGPFTKKCEHLLEAALGGGCRVLLTTSCTSALEMAALLLDLQEGDEVILPSFTFVSTANAFLLRGCVLKFADVDPDSMNISLAEVERLTTKETKVIVPVHYGGVSCDMDALKSFCAEREIYLVEDAAQALGSSYNGKPLGTFGELATFSFHETKNIICGEGGALVINDPKYFERAEIIREKGTNRSQFFRGQVDKYTWVDIGSSYVMSDMLAAYLFAQLENMDEINKLREEAFSYYVEQLRPLEEQGLIKLQKHLPKTNGNGHLFYLLTQSSEQQKDMLEYLNEQGVNAVFHYLPLHTSNRGVQFSNLCGALPITEKQSYQLVRLPMYHKISRDELDQVIQTIYQFYKGS